MSGLVGVGLSLALQKQQHMSLAIGVTFLKKKNTSSFIVGKVGTDMRVDVSEKFALASITQSLLGEMGRSAVP